MAPAIRLMTPRGQMSGANNKPAMAEMPPQIKLMFAPRPLLPNPHPSLAKKKKRTGATAHLTSFSGLAGLKNAFEAGPTPEREKSETSKQARERRRNERVAANAEQVAKKSEAYDATATPKAGDELTADAYKTLFVGRLNYDTGLSKLRREFERFGAVKNARIVSDEEGKPRGYAFLEFEDENEMRAAYRAMNGRMLDGRRVVVDVERGRTVKDWRPRRLGGGLGAETRRDRPKKSLLPPSARGAQSTLRPVYGSLARGGGGGSGPPPDRRGPPPRARSPPRGGGSMGPGGGGYGDRGRSGLGYGDRPSERPPPSTSSYGGDRPSSYNAEVRGSDRDSDRGASVRGASAYGGRDSHGDRGGGGGGGGYGSRDRGRDHDRYGDRGGSDRGGRYGDRESGGSNYGGSGGGRYGSSGDRDRDRDRDRYSSGGGRRRSRSRDRSYGGRY